MTHALAFYLHQLSPLKALADQEGEAGMTGGLLSLPVLSSTWAPAVCLKCPGHHEC